MSAEDASSLSFWSAIGSVGFVMVIVGVVMEGAELLVRVAAWTKRKRAAIIWNKLPELHVPRWAHIMDHIGWLILVIGLVLEFLGHWKETDIKDREIGRLTKELSGAVVLAGEANKQASLTESNNLILRSNVVVLETSLVRLRADTLPRRITEQQIERFIELTKQSSKCHIKVIVGMPVANETATFANRVREMLDRAGFWTNKEPVIGIPGLGNTVAESRYGDQLAWMIGTSFGDPTAKIPYSNQVPSIIVLTNAPDGYSYSRMGMTRKKRTLFLPGGTNVTIQPEGTEVAYTPTDDPALILYGVCEVLMGMEIRVDQIRSLVTVGPGEVAIVIPPRIY